MTPDGASGSGTPGVPDGGLAAVSRAELYSSLVTRQTGRAVRMGIEEQLAGRSGPVVTVLDFREVSVIDFSCADEVAAKLAGSAVTRDGDGRPAGGEGSPERFFLFTGLDEHHLDPVESALRRRELAVAARRIDGTPLVLGELEDRALRAWEWLCRAGGARVGEAARELEMESAAAARLLRALHRRRLVLRREREFVSLMRAVARAAGDGTGGERGAGG